MAEIVPQTTIRLLIGVPLSPENENTFYFTSQQEQLAYFNAHFAYREYTQQSYQRKERGWIRLQADYKDVYNVNYLIFNNIALRIDNTSQAYENKWFYCFVTEVRYINEYVCEFAYEVDVLQSYMFNWVFHDTFVEREVVAEDSYYDYYIDEGLPCSEYDNSLSVELLFTLRTPSQTTLTRYLRQMRYVVLATFTRDFRDGTDGVSSNSKFGNAIVGCKYIDFTPTSMDENGDMGAAACLAWLDDLTQNHPEKVDGVLGIYLVPYVISLDPEQKTLANCTISDGPDTISFNGYIPKNKKMYHSPYVSLVVQNSEGASCAYDVTQFGSRNFILDYSPNMPIQGSLYPQSYKAQSSNFACPSTYAIPMPSIPQFAFSNDTYKAWAALNMGYVNLSVAGSISDIATTLAGAAVSMNYAAGFGATANTISIVGQRELMNNAGGLRGDVTNILSNMIAVNNAKIVPDSYNGSNTNQALAINNRYGFFKYVRTAKEDIARSIDKFFTMYGYKVNIVKTPSIHNRTRFTYLKTSNMDIEGNIPADDKSRLDSIFNSGVRFWVDKANFCNYSIDNTELS